MEQDELDRAAWRGDEVPPELSGADTIYFLMLRSLYAFYRLQHSDAEAGRREKEKISDVVRRFQMAQDAAKRYGEVMRDTGAARAVYRQARNDMGSATALYLPAPVVAAIAAADALVEALDGLKIEG